MIQSPLCFKLSSMRPNTHVVVFMVAICAESVSDLKSVDGFSGQLIDLKTNTQLCSFEHSGDFSADTIVVAMMIRDGSDWFFVVVDETLNAPKPPSDPRFYQDLYPNLRKLFDEVSLQSIFEFGRSKMDHVARLQGSVNGQRRSTEV